MEEAFFLNYGGLRFGYRELLEMPTDRRKWLVERLKQQLDHERKEMKK